MGGGNWDYILRNKWELEYSLRLPMGTKSWEWEGVGTLKSFPHISTGFMNSAVF